MNCILSVLQIIFSFICACISGFSCAGVLDKTLHFCAENPHFSVLRLNLSYFFIVKFSLKPLLILRD